jgi:hypothetical protein
MIINACSDNSGITGHLYLHVVKIHCLVTSMKGMFHWAIAFNRDWNTDAVWTMEEFFSAQVHSSAAYPIGTQLRT